MDRDTKIVTNGAPTLKARKDWPQWYLQLQVVARGKWVWEDINPDNPDVPDIVRNVPKYPELPAKPIEPKPLPIGSTTEQVQGFAKSTEEYKQDLAVYESRLKDQQETVRRWKVQTAEWTRKANGVIYIQEYMTKTISASLLQPVQIQLLDKNETGVQQQLRLLKRQLAPSEATLKNQIRVEYRSHLEKAKAGRMGADTWFNEWQLLYSRARAYGVPEIEGTIALTDFLDAITVKYAPEWARQMRIDVIKRASLNEPDLDLDDVATVFNAMLAEQTSLSGKGRSSSIFSIPTLNKESARNDQGSKPGTGRTCPCRPGSAKHKWDPISCRRLQTAVEGSAPSIPIKLSKVDKKKILERYNKSEWSDLRNKVKQSGWKTEARATAAEGSFPNAVQATLIDPKSFKIDIPDNAGVYSTTYSQHPLSQSTILDNGACVHLVNNRDLLVPGTFRRSEANERVDAGTQSLPIEGYGTRVFKNLLTGPNGPNTLDLTLTEVRVVEGFHLNIVSEHRLHEHGKIWYMGFDRTLRYGTATRNTVVFKLINKGNLNFLEYKISSYSKVPLLVKAVQRSFVPRMRTDSEMLWHRRSGHLGPRALRALVQAARNVQIDGTKRIDCEDCSVTHATQVISRKPKERSPRPFYRISWDLFDMPQGRLLEHWSLVIKEDFSGKIENNNLPSKSLPEIMRVIKRYAKRAETKYGLKIVEIHQDSDSATRPWRGRSTYEEWAEDEGITIKATPSHTHEPNGAAERAGQEIITKAIKMRHSANLPKKLWPEIMDAAAWLHSMSPSSTHDFRSPNEVLDSWFRQYFRWYEPAAVRSRTADLRPDWSGIYAYGCRAYPLKRDRAAGLSKRDFKINPRGHVGYLVGYRASNIYRIWVPTLDQIITTRNVTFDESRFYAGDPEEEMEKEEAIEIVELLHDVELEDPGKDLDEDFILEEQQAFDPSLEPETNLGGEHQEQFDVGGRPAHQESPGNSTAREASSASELLRIRVGPAKDQNQLATPEATPEPGDTGEDDEQEDHRVGADSQEVVHTPGRAGSSGSSDRLGSYGEEPGSSTRSATRTERIDSNAPDEAEEVLTRARKGLRRTPTPSRSTRVEPQTQPTQRLSRRQQGKAPEISGGVHKYPPQRRRRDRDDQMGGGNTGVHALIANLDMPNDLWADFENTFLPGARRAWDDRGSYKPMNAVVMAATLKEHTEKPIHVSDLPAPPTTWKQLLQHPLRTLFEQASRKEIEQLRNKGTWTEQSIENSPSRPLPLKWVWTYKIDQDGMFIKCKARIVVRGDLQEKDTLDSTYAATLAARSFRAAMAIAAHFDLEILQYDVVGAFLNALITSENPVFCDLPEGFRKAGLCVRLNRALYGLRDSPLLWYEEFAGTLRSFGLISAKEEPCLFFTEDRKILILFYVDDILLLYHRASEAEARNLRDRIMGKYEIQEQGEVNWFLGIRVIRNRAERTITLVHDTYIDKMAKKFGLSEGAFPPTPLPSEELIKSTGEATKAQIKKFQEKVGSVLYTAIMLRPDVSFAVSKLSHFLTNPSEQHMKAVDRVITYLYRTRWESIQYGNYNGPDLVICGDASFADDPDTRRSSHGYIAMLFGGAIFWKAARQSTITTSTTEAELLALEQVAKESMALKRFFNELTLELGDLWNIWCDNQQTIRLVVGKNERITTKLRHVDIQNMWLRQEHAKGSFEVEYLKTSEMPADGLTKSLTQQQFLHFKRLLNLQDSSKLVRETTKQ